MEGWMKALGPLPQFVGTDSVGTYRRAATSFYVRTVINRNVETGSDPKSV
jgi:hypothetical protein